MQQLLDAISETVNPATKVVGVNLFDSPQPLSDVKIRVKEHPLAICQQIAYSRLYGWSTWCTAETSHCVLGACNCGLIDVPERVENGEVNSGVYQVDQASAKKMQAAMPRLDRKMGGVLTYSMDRPQEGLQPDLLVVYVNTAQAMRFVQAFLYAEGGEFVMRSSGDAGVCSRGVAQVFKEQQPAVEIPCLGDRRFAMTQDHEMIVGIPASWYERAAHGLLATHKAGIRYPIPFQIPDPCALPEPFVTSVDDCE